MLTNPRMFGRRLPNCHRVSTTCKLPVIVHWNNWTPLVMAMEVVGAHDLGIAKRVCQHENGGELILLAISKCQRCIMALCIMIVKEDNSGACFHFKILAWPQVCQLAKLAISGKARRYLVRIFEELKCTRPSVLAWRDGFVRACKDLLKPENSFSFCSHLNDRLEVLHVNMFRCIDAEACYPKVDHFRQECRHLLLHVGAAGAKVWQAI
mmetsp:Transcript_26160/g.51215  ORF Transcript_26160/g.51215 Transcript_26160/m.51215 type:complete len:209 (-) Transcript_26160:225-851(-)